MEEDPDIPVLMPEISDAFCKGFIHEKEFPGNGWRRGWLCMDQNI